jgi:hypothetical protein
MVSFWLSMTAVIIVFAALCACAAAGFRNGDRLADATVTALLRDAGQPDEPRPVVVATVRNPSERPLLAGLSVRRAALPGRGGNVTVPHRTARRRLRACGYATIGVVRAYGIARLTVPVSVSARRYLLTAAIGQADGRLRLHRLRVTHGQARAKPPIGAARALRRGWSPPTRWR